MAATEHRCKRRFQSLTESLGLEKTSSPTHDRSPPRHPEQSTERHVPSFLEHQVPVSLFLVLSRMFPSTVTSKTSLDKVLSDPSPEPWLEQTTSTDPPNPNYASVCDWLVLPEFGRDGTGLIPGFKSKAGTHFTSGTPAPLSHSSHNTYSRYSEPKESS